MTFLTRILIGKIEIGLNLEYFDMTHHCIIFEESIHMGSNSSDPAHVHTQ